MTSFAYVTKFFSGLSLKDRLPLVTHIAKLATEATSATATSKPNESIDTKTQEKEQQKQEQFKDRIKAGVFGRALFPTIDTHTSLVIDSVPFDQLHVINIKSSKNNTIISVSDHTGKVLFLSSSGSNGFKNAKKSTTTGAQAAALTIADFLKRRQISNVRVVLKGLGNGRAATVKSLQMSEINIVSLTDNTLIPLPYSLPLRPKKQRRV